jgi:hypothetical protein
MKKILLFYLCSFFYFQVSGQDNDANRIAQLRKEIKEALKDTTDSGNKEHPLIPDEKTAIAIVEPILFKFYGEEKIKNERPYKSELVDGYWLIKGSLPAKYKVGGTFSVIINSVDGRIIKFTHYK